MKTTNPVMSNPYLVLGVTSEWAKELPDDEELDTFTQMLYRILAKRHHPDRGKGSEARFFEIQEAWKTLENPETKSFWRRELRRKKPGGLKATIAKLTQELVSRDETLDQLIERFGQWWRAPLQSEFHGNEHEIIKVAPLFPVQRLSFLLMAAVEGKMSSELATSTEGGMKMAEKIFSGSTVELILSQRGLSLTRQKVEKRFFHKQDGLPTTVFPRWIQERAGLSNPRSYYWQRVGEVELLENFRLIGSLPSKELFESNKSQVGEGRALLSSSPTGEDYCRVRGKGFSWEMFRNYVRLVEPAVVDHYELVAIRCVAKEPPSFHLLGRVQQINLLEE